LGRALFLPGAINGIIYFLKPSWEKLADFEVILINFLFFIYRFFYLKIINSKGLGKCWHSSILFLRNKHVSIGCFGEL
jgi:hypothetical protein